jgi:hypothetical protein
MSTTFTLNAAKAQRRRSALSYGPFGYLALPVLGFVLGGGAFLLFDATATAHNAFDELPLLLKFVVAGAALGLTIAIIANWLIGTRVRAQLEFEREIFGGPDLPPMRPRPDVPGIMLQPLAAYADRAENGVLDEMRGSDGAHAR